MSAVTLDADVVIGLLDAADAHHDAAVRTLDDCDADHLLMSTSTLSEVLVEPLRAGRADEVERLLRRLDVRYVAVDVAIARLAAELRARHRPLRLPDALALATSQRREAPLLTFDQRLRRLT